MRDDKEEGAKKGAAKDLRTLRVLLRRTGRDLVRPVVIEGALWFGATVLAVLLVGLLVAAVIPNGYTLGRWVMGIGLLSATLGALSALGMFLWRRPDAAQVAARVQRHSPEFRSDLVAALEFGERLTGERGESLADQGVSESLAAAHLAQTVKRANEVAKKSSLAHLIPRRDLTPPILAVSGGLALMVIPFVLDAGWTLGVLSGERMGSPVVGERVDERPMVSSVDAVFVYPSYTGLDRQFVHLGSGGLETLEGTEVHLTVRLVEEFQDVELVVESGDGEKQAQEMRREGPTTASTTLEIAESGHYWFRGVTAEGRPVEDRTPRRLRVVADEAPRVRLTSHEPGRIEAQPEDVVEFSFTATDDFGIQAVTAVYYFEGADEEDAHRERLELPGLSNSPREVDGTYTFDLQPLHLQPKDSVVVYFEARDNNSATGPGIGRSGPVVLYVESPEDQHMRNLADQQEMMEALLLHLADFLESPVGPRERQRDGTYMQIADREMPSVERVDQVHRIGTLHGDRVEILARMEGLIEVMEEDPLVVPRNLTLFQGLHRRLDRVHQRGDELLGRLRPRTDRNDVSDGNLQDLADYASVTEEELERGILSLEELLISQKMELVQATADEIENLRQRLRELLEQYQETQDPELREAIQREMQRLRQRLQELMERMQMQMREMPREHVNMEALEQMNLEEDTGNVADQLRSIEEMIEAGDIEGALAMLDEMEMSLQNLSQGMGDSFSQLEPQGISELDEAVAEMMDEVNQLEERERAIEEQTRELQEQLREERQEELERQLAPLRRELLREIERQESQIERIDERPLPLRERNTVDRSRETIERLREMVEQDDLEQALERARQSETDLRRMRSSMQGSERFTREEEQRRALEQSSADSNQMIQRASEIRERLEEFMQQAQQDLTPGQEGQFDELAQQQQEAAERAEALRQRVEQEGERFPALQEELQPSLESVQEAMNRATESLQERRMQPALDAERQAIEELGQLRQSMSQALERQRQQDRDQSGQERSSERVEIPGEDSGEARERLRRELMEGMREGRLDDYESQIERYFRSLVE